LKIEKQETPPLIDTDDTDQKKSVDLVILVIGNQEGQRRMNG